jgi:hypothetical protein
VNQKLLGLYGLKFNPFSPELPTEALLQTSKIDSFCWRVENSLVREGGFALISGDPGPARVWCFVCSPIGWRDGASLPSGLSPMRPHDLQIFIDHVDIDMIYRNGLSGPNSF